MTNKSSSEVLGGGAYPVKLERPSGPDAESVVWVGGDAVCDALAPWYAGCGDTESTGLNIMFKNAPHPNR